MTQDKDLARSALFLAVLSTLCIAMATAALILGDALAVKAFGALSLIMGAALAVYTASLLARIGNSNNTQTPEQFAQLLLQTQQMVEASKRLKEDQHTLTQLLHQSPNPCCIKNQDNHCVFVNNAWVQHTQIAADPWLNQQASVSALFDSNLRDLDSQTLATGTQQRLAFHDTVLGDISIKSTPLLSTSGVLAGTLVWLDLATESDAAISTLTDPLTQLGNHRFAVEWLQLAVTAQEQGLAVVVINLVGFAAINREQGHDIGDALLAEIGVRLATLCDANVQAARLERDHFALLLKNIPEPDLILARVAQVNQVLNLSYAPLLLGSAPQFVLGLARLPEDADTPWMAIDTAQRDMQTQYALQQVSADTPH